MSKESKSVKDIFLAAVDKQSPADRAAFLDEACAGDAALRGRVEALLKAHDEPGSFLERPAIKLEPSADLAGIPVQTGESVEAGSPPVPAGSGNLAGAPESPPTTEDEPKSERPGTVIGPYKLLQQLGEGGMGTVYMAQQTEPVKRLVALKIIKAGMDSAEVLARFEQERQALAMMDHPNIAKVLDAGTIGQSEPQALATGQTAPLPHAQDSKGRPYFVMELVKGIPITKFSDQEHLSPKERLELFIPVCQAVQHAHQKGIIHRDLKPSNVIIALYDGKPVPKVIDFGVAKATQQKLIEQTMFTQVGQILGTLEYMAPEQAELNNLDIDTRADIYSLGVMLYELLTGSPPFTRQQLRSAAFTEMLRIIREVEPPKPSTKLSSSNDLPSIAAKRKLEPKRLCKLVHGDLDWIVMKALEKDRGRRYETANGLAMDIHRYLADEPVLASPPSASYRIRKFVRRNKGLVMAACIIVMLLVGGIVGTSLGFARADRLRKLAEQRESEALEEKANAEASQRQAMDALRATTDDVVEQLIGAKPMLGPAEKTFMENTLKRWQTFAAERGEGEQARAIRAEGTARVADLWQNLGQHETGLGGYQEAISLFEKLVADFPAVPHYRRKLAASHNNLGLILNDIGKRPEAEDAYRQALAIQGNLVADFPAVPLYRYDLAKHHYNLGLVLGDLGQRLKAERAYREALTIEDKLVADFPAVPEYRQSLVLSQNSLGGLLHDLGKDAEAEAAYRKALLIQERLAAEFSAMPKYRGELAGVHNNLGILLRDIGRPTEAEAASREALTIQDKLASDFPAVPKYRIDLAGGQVNLGNVLRTNRQPEQALEWYAKAIATLESVLRQVKVDVTAQEYLCNAHWGRANALVELKRFAQAEADHRRVVAVREKLAAEFPAIPAYRIELGGSQCNFGIMLHSSMQSERALEWYSKAIETLDDALRQVRADVKARQFLGNAYLDRALAYDDLKRHAEAAADFDKALDLSPEPRRTAIRVRRALCRARAGQVDVAIQEAEELAKNANSNMLYNAACVFALVSAASQPKSLPQGAREQYDRRAVALLQQAIAKGYKDVEHMKKDDDLKSLRERGDFKKLLGELEKQSPKRSDPSRSKK